MLRNFFNDYLKKCIEDKLFTPLNLTILSQLKIFELSGQNEELRGYYNSLKDFLIQKYFKEDPDLFASQLEKAVLIAKTPKWKGEVKALESEIAYSLQQTGIYHNN